MAIPERPRQSFAESAELSPLERQRRVVLRTAKTVVIACAGLAVAIGFATPTLSQSSLDASWGFLPALLLAFLAVIGLMTLAFVYGDLWMVRSLRPVESEVVEARFVGFRGLMAVLRDGTVLSAPSLWVACTLFFAADGRVLRPSVRQAIEWSRWRSTRRIAFVGGRRGPPELRAELEVLKKRVATMMPMCSVRERRTPKDALSPRWIVQAAFPPHVGPLSRALGIQVVSELPAVTGLMRHALGSAVPGVATTAGA